MKNLNNRKKVLVLAGTLKTIPPIGKDYPGIVDLIYKPLDFIHDKDIKVISLWNDGLKDVSYNKEKYLHVKINGTEIIEKIPYRLRKQIYGFADPKRIIYYSKMILKMWGIKPDIVISHVDPKLAILVSRAYPKAEHIYYYHGSILERLFNSCEEWVFFNSRINKLIIICNATIKSVVRKFGSIKIKHKTIMNGIEPSTNNCVKLTKTDARNHFGLKETDIVIIYAGRLTQTKGISDLIAGFIDSYKSNNNLRLLIAGDPQKETYGDFDYFRTLLEQAAMVPDNVIQFVGWLSRDELELLYSAGDISALTSTREGGEGNSLFLMDSMAHGLACIATDVGGNPEVVNDAGIIISPENIRDDISDKIINLTSEQKRRELGQKASERAKFFTYERLAQELQEFLDTPV